MNSKLNLIKDMGCNTVTVKSTVIMNVCYIKSLEETSRKLNPLRFIIQGFDHITLLGQFFKV